MSLSEKRRRRLEKQGGYTGTEAEAGVRSHNQGTRGWPDAGRCKEGPPIPTQSLSLQTALSGPPRRRRPVTSRWATEGYWRRRPNLSDFTLSIGAVYRTSIQLLKKTREEHRTRDVTVMQRNILWWHQHRVPTCLCPVCFYTLRDGHTTAQSKGPNGRPHHSPSRRGETRPCPEGLESTRKSEEDENRRG